MEIENGPAVEWKMVEVFKPCPKCGSDKARLVTNSKPEATVIWCNDCGFSVYDYERDFAIGKWNDLSDIAKPFWSRRVKGELNKTRAKGGGGNET